MAISFTNSWFGVIFNPVGYSAQRKSVSESAKDYFNKNKPDAFLNSSYDELSFNENRTKWIEACASKLKSDDVAKSIANCRSGCAKEFDNYSGTLSKNKIIVLNAVNDKEEVEQRVEKNKKIFIGAVIALLIITIIIFLPNKTKQ